MEICDEGALETSSFAPDCANWQVCKHPWFIIIHVITRVFVIIGKVLLPRTRLGPDRIHSFSIGNGDLIHVCMMMMLVSIVDGALFLLCLSL